ncbi:MAG: T9SS type A sorting domain-containing protein [Cytophagaceae bacterium]|nr:T9SS type A sorting domain-containing protein [Cytophagaceae bacterium]
MNAPKTPNPPVPANFDSKLTGTPRSFLSAWRAWPAVFLLLFLTFAAEAQDRCATAKFDSVLNTRVAGWQRSRQRLEALVQQKLAQQPIISLERARAEATLLRIPVVVHVVHNNAAGVIGGPDKGNISEQQILSQIQVLNEDYRRLPGTNGFNTNPVGADMEIEFFLATLDPAGNPTNGITRHYSPRTDFDVFDDDQTLADIVSWPSDRYLNIWVVTFSSSGYLGIAQYPAAEGIAGLDTTDADRVSTDGVIIDHRSFGSNTGTTVSGSYKDGRTATHEIGHWLGLIHTWGDSFCGDDFCADIPVTERPNRTRNCTEMFSNCNGTRTRNMIENYLDYSPDLCMNTFTEDQKRRVRAVLTASPRRRRLVSSTNVLAETEQLQIKIFPNPAKTYIELDAQFQGLRDVTLSLLDVQGRLLFTQTFPDRPSNHFIVSQPNLPAGLYLVRVEAGDEVVVKRVYLTQ